MEYIYLLQHTKPDPDDKLITDSRLSISADFFFIIFCFILFLSIIPHRRSYGS